MINTKRDFRIRFAQEVQMDRMYEETDILSLHIPLTAETKSLVNQDYLKRFKKKIILINTARGEIVPLADLASADGRGAGTWCGTGCSGK